MERSTSFDRTDVLCGLWSENVCSPGKQRKESSTVYLFSIQHRINADVVMELIKELLKAIAEYSQLNREEFIETVRKAQTSQQSSEITRLKSRLSEAQKRVQDLEKLLCRIYEDNILGKLPDERYAVLDGQYSKEQKELSAEIAEIEAELSGYEEEKQWLKKQNFKNTAEDAYTG